MTEKLLEARNIRKEFGSVVANRDVDFDLKKGEVHSILGENGAGKSTFMKVLYGVYNSDGGEVLVRDNLYNPNSPAEALERGIGLVYQEFKLIEPFTVLDNVVLGLTDGDWLEDDVEEHRKAVADLSKRYGLRLEDRLDWRVSELSEGEKQRVELLKVLYRDIDILLLDEPTSILTPNEVDALFEVINTLVKTEDLGVVLITHKLEEALEVSDRITVLRDGEVVGHTAPNEASQEVLAQMMVGRDEVKLVERQTRKTSPSGSSVLSVQNLNVTNLRGQQAIDNISFSVDEGEIFGVVGVEGNGQNELGKTISGLLTPNSGTITLNGEDITNASRRKLQSRGVVLIPDSHGVISTFSIPDNCILDDYTDYYDRWVRNEEKIDQAARKIIDEYDVRIPSFDATAAQLSGGNKQKVVLGRKLSNDNRQVLIAVNPTKGLDIDTKTFIHDKLLEEKDNKRSVLLITTDLEEALAISDTLVAINEGQFVETFDPETASREEIGLAMTKSKGEYDE